MVEPALKSYFQVKGRLSYIGGLVTCTFDEGHIRLVVLKNLRERVASNLHSGHQGVDSLLCKAWQAVYWPEMEAGIWLQQSKYTVHSPSKHQEPLMLTQPQKCPFQKIVVDFFM